MGDRAPMSETAAGVIRTDCMKYMAKNLMVIPAGQQQGTAGADGMPQMHPECCGSTASVTRQSAGLGAHLTQMFR